MISRQVEIDPVEKDGRLQIQRAIRSFRKVSIAVAKKAKKKRNIGDSNFHLATLFSNVIIIRIERD